MWGAQSAPSAKTWVGNYPPCPPISYIPKKTRGLFTQKPNAFANLVQKPHRNFVDSILLCYFNFIIQVIFCLHQDLGILHQVHIEFVHLIRFMLQIGNLRYIYNQKLHKNNFKDENEKIYIFLRNTLTIFLGILFANQNF